MILDDLPSGWEVWNEEPGGQVILAYRPEVFDASSFPPECMPTITVDRGRSPDQAPDHRLRSGSWYVAFYLEPLVRVRASDGTFETRGAAIDGARDVARRFAGGDVDYRSAYQVPREEYLAELDALVGA